MNTSRNGKIARLPHKIREQLNHRIQDGEKAKSLAKWLNSLPEVQSILDHHFSGRPINAVNLTEWKDGGYRDWLVRQDAQDFVQDLEDTSALGSKSSDNTVGAMLSHWVALHYGASAKALAINELDPHVKWARLHQLCLDVTRLRRVELAAERLELETTRFNTEQGEAHRKELDQMKKDLRASELLLNILHQEVSRGHSSTQPAPAHVHDQTGSAQQAPANDHPSATSESPSIDHQCDFKVD